MDNKFENNIKIIGNAKIPDSDAVNWVRSLYEAGLSEKEVNIVMAGLNKTYRKQKGQDWVELELKKIEGDLKETGRLLTEQQKTYLRKSILERED